MKKILYSLIALFAVGFTACAEFEEPVVENYGEGPAIGVAAATADSTITLTLTVDTVNTTYFAYALFEGATETPDAAQLLKATAGGAVAEMVKAAEVKWNGKNEKSISFTELMPNTEYHIYAVASSKYGVIGEIADTLVVTTDGLSPFVVEADQDSTTFYVAFSEEVTVGEGKVSVEYYESWGDFAAATPVAEEDVKVLAEGNVAVIETANIPAGAYALVSWEVGAFVDAKGNKCNAFATGFGEEGFDGVWGQMPNTTINVVDSAAVNEGPFADWATFVGVVKYPTAIFDMRNDVDEEGNSLHEDVELGSLKVVYTSEGYEATIDVKKWTVRNDSLLFALPMEPEFGMVVDVVVGANVVRDINGNMNAAFATENAWLRSYGLTAAGVAGKYTASFYAQGAEGLIEATEEVTISAIEGVADSVLINGVFGMETPIKAAFDGDYATITVKHVGYVYSDEDYDYYTYDGSGAGKNIVFVYDAATGTFATDGYLCMVYAVGNELLGYAAVTAEYTMTPATATEEDAQ